MRIFLLLVMILGVSADYSFANVTAKVAFIGSKFCVINNERTEQSLNATSDKVVCLATGKALNVEVCTARCVGFANHGLTGAGNIQLCRYQNQTCWNSSIYVQCNGDADACGVMFSGYAPFFNDNNFNGTFSQFCNPITVNDVGCYCKKGNIVNDLKVDCGSGYFSPSNISSIVIPVKASSKTINTNVDKMISESDIYSVEMNVERVLRLRVRPSNVKRIVGVIEVMRRYNSFKTTTFMYPINAQSKRAIIDVNHVYSNESFSIGIVTESGHPTFYEVPSRQTQIKEEKEDFVTANLTASQLCSLDVCEFCDDNTLWFYCKVKTFGFIKSSVIVVAAILICCFFPHMAASVKSCFNLLRGSYHCMDRLNIRMSNIADQAKRAKMRMGMKRVPTNDDEEGLMEMNEDVGKKEDKIGDLTVGSTLKVFDVNSKTEMFVKRTGESSYVMMDGDDKIVRTMSRSEMMSMKMVLYVMIVCCILPSALGQCSESVIMTSDVTSCTKFNQTHSECYVRPNMRISNKGPGSRTCVVINDRNSTRIGSMNVTFSQLLGVGSLSLQYYTCDWKGGYTTHRKCFLESPCTYDQYGNCGAWASSGNVNPGGIFSQDDLLWPGVMGCSSIDGCAGNGCFSCAPQCGWWRWWLEMAEPCFPVYKVSLVSYSVSMEIDLAIGNNKTSFKVTSSQPTYDDVNLSASIEGVFIDFGIIFTKSIIDLDGGSFYTETSPQNNPAVGLIGDVQSASLSDIRSAQNTLMNKNIANANIQPKSSVFAFSNSGFNAADLSRQFPTDIAGFSWVRDRVQNQIIARIDRALNAEVGIEFKSDFKFYRMDESVCPKIVFERLYGCYDCAPGATIELRGESSCFEGNCYTFLESGSQMLQNDVYLGLTNKSMNVSAMFSNSSVSDTLTIVCGSNRMSVTVIGELTTDDKIISQAISYKVPTQPTENFDPFVSQFAVPGTEKGWKIAEMILIAIGVVIGTVLAVGIAFFSIKYFMSRAGKSLSVKRFTGYGRLM